MGNLKLGVELSSEIKILALNGIKRLSSSNSAYYVAKKRIKRPVDYMRYAEYDAILRDLAINSQMKILDVSSPQWFSLYLAYKYPNTSFFYINIIDDELKPYSDIMKALEIKNLNYIKEDVRHMSFKNNIFDKVISISVIEHIYPENGGDLSALNEIYRVLKLEGELFLTVPYKSQSNIIYVDSPVYERIVTKRNFFAREYDEEMFNKLLNRSKFSLESTWFICERKGLFSLDYYEWGPGKDIFIFKYLNKFRRLLEYIFGKSLDEIFAKKYLNASREVIGRPVNISTKLCKTKVSI